MLAASDIPAARKLCGFQGHSAERACPKCFKGFPGSVEDWETSQDLTENIGQGSVMGGSKRYADKVRKASDKTMHEKLATRYGCYFSVLLELEYFDAIRFSS